MKKIFEIKNMETFIQTRESRVSINQRLLLIACCTFSFVCASYAQDETIESAPVQETFGWTEDELRDAQPLPNPPWDPVAAEEMLQKGDSSQHQSTKAVSKGNFGRPPVTPIEPELDNFIHTPAEKVDSLKEDLLGLDDEYNIEKEALPKIWLSLISQSFRSSIVNILRKALVPAGLKGDDLVLKEELDELTSIDLAFPYMTVGKLFTKKPDGRSHVCSAAVADPKIVITAAHCIHNGNGLNSGWHTDFVFVPAYKQNREGRGVAPYKIWTANWVYVPGEWFHGGGRVPNRADYGILIMNDIENQSIGDVVGWLGWKSNSLSINGENDNDDWRSTHVTVLGYPAVIGDSKYILQEMAQIISGVKPFRRSEDNAIIPSIFVIGSDWRYGAGGALWIKDFGYIQDENGNRVLNNNHVVSVTSFVNNNPNINYNGGAEFDERWVNFWKAVCSQHPESCSGLD